MGISLRIINLDGLFGIQNSEPIIVNHFNIQSETDKDRLNQLIYTHYEGDSLNILPSCLCGMTTGEYNVGITCHNCNTKVLSVTEQPLESALWIEPPNGVDTFINPQVWTILSERLTYPGVNLLEWLVNPLVQMPAEPSKEARRLQTLNMERGINFFHRNFDQVMEVLFEQGIVKGTKKQRETLREFISQNRAAIFNKRLPIPSKLGFITEKTVTSTYADLTMLPAVDAIRTISTTVNSQIPLRPHVLQSRAMKANALLAEYHQNFIAQMGAKPGWFRKHVFGSRLHFTFRAVISSLSDNHEYDELHLPWSMSVMAFEAHLTSKLNRPGFTPNDCVKFLHEHVLRYHPLLDELFKELIRESPHRGVPVLLNRNPTLMRGSIQTLRVTQIKTDTKVNSISMSVLCLAATNADFDGRALPSLNLSNCWKLLKAA